MEKGAKLPLDAASSDLWLVTRLLVVLLGDDVDRDNVRSSDEGAAVSVLGQHLHPISQFRSAPDAEAPHPISGVIDTEQIVGVAISKRDPHLHDWKCYGTLKLRTASHRSGVASG